MTFAEAVRRYGDNWRRAFDMHRHPKLAADQEGQPRAAVRDAGVMLACSTTQRADGGFVWDPRAWTGVGFQDRLEARWASCAPGARR